MSDKKNLPDSAGVSRRGFLKGIGVGTVAGGLLSPAGLKEAIAKDAQVLGPGEIPITLNINGKSRTLKVEPRVTLLDALRNRLDLTGAKKVCDRGTCGACTVIVDGHPAYSCSLLAVEAEGREINPVEGLGTPARVNAAHAAFI